MLAPALTVRAATAADSLALAHLAGHARPRGAALLAELDGVLVASVSLTSGAVVADPLVPTADAVRALHRRRYRILRQGGDVAPGRIALRTVRPQPRGGHVQALLAAEARA